MGRPLAAIAAGLLLAVAAVGLTFRASTGGPADFTFVNGSEPQTLDPSRMTGQPAHRIAAAIFEGLTRRDAKSLEAVGGVAERWETSPDGLTWTFHLRDDALWSDGVPVRAQDFAYAWRRLLDPGTGAEYAYLLHGLRLARAFHRDGAEAEALAGPVREALAALAEAHPEGVPAATWNAFALEQRLASRLEGADAAPLRALAAGTRQALAPAALAAVDAALSREAARRRASADHAAAHFGVDAGVIAVDPSTLVVELTAPIPYFLELTSFFSTLPLRRDVVEARPRDWFLPEHIVANGPFLLESWRVGDRARLVKNPRYWGRDAVQLRSIDALPVENPTTALNLYLSGAVDWLPGLYPDELVDVLHGRPDFYSAPGMIVYYYRLNLRKPPLDDPRVRQAIGLAIDRREITKEVLGLGQIPALTVVPPGMPGYRPPESGYGYDVERARRLLAEAGHPGGRGLRELGILYNTHESHRKIAEVIADQLRRNLGLRVRAYNQEWQSYLASLAAGDYDIGRAGWIGDYLDPNTFLDLWVTGGGNNQTGWGDPDYDALIAAAGDPGRASREPARVLDVAPDAAAVEPLLAAATLAVDPEQRRRALASLRLELLRQAEGILVGRGFPVIPIYFYVVSGLVQPHVRGFYSQLTLPDGSHAANLQDLHPLRELRIDRAAR